MIIENAADRKKFEEIYLKFHRLMFCVSFEVLRNKQAAEDVVHQAFVHIAENINKIDVDKSCDLEHYLVALSKEKADEVSRVKSVG